MEKIHLMDDNLANKIAAGEVIESCMNVVKELTENSIDAGSDEIIIKLIDSGIKEIKVTDNGSGMSRKDALLCFERHATSKIQTLDDLFNIETLGFRGEALPSIAAISKLTLTTCDNNESTTINIAGGKIINTTNAEFKKGTTITVKNIFYNTPVRLKYLKNLYIELANITDYVNKMALANPNIKFTLINNDKVLLNTDGKNNLLKVINTIYGLNVSKKMIAVDNEDDDYHITGYISYPECTRINRNSIITFVNGRLIKNNDLNRSIIDSYHTYIPKDKYPIIIINIEVDSSIIDVNIHPTKMDIKFSKLTELKALITNIIETKLNKLLLIPTGELDNYEQVNNLLSNNSEELSLNLYPEENPLEHYIKETPQLDLNYDNDPTYKDETLTKPESRIKYMHPVGIVHSTYIIAENDLGMFMIDQHAAQERINYERYLKAMSQDDPNIIDLLIPINIELSNKDYLILKQHLDILANLGFNIEEFGLNSIMVRSHPFWLPKSYEKQAINKIIEIIVSSEDFSKQKFIEKTAITLSCKMAIKANDHISLEEAEQLLNTLRECSNPFTCPHGRPTIITYSKYDLEKMFKRAMN